MMRTLFRVVLLTVILMSPLAAQAAVPTALGFTARIADAGQPASGNHSFTFTFWNDPAATADANKLGWTETQTNVPVNGGVVSVTLGGPTGTAIDPNIFSGGAAYLEIQYDGTTLSPRIQVLAVPYALRSAYAETAGTANSANTANSATTAGSVAWSGVTGQPTLVTGTASNSVTLVSGGNFIWQSGTAVSATQSGLCLAIGTATVTGITTNTELAHLWVIVQDVAASPTTYTLGSFAQLSAPLGGGTSATTSYAFAVAAGHGYRFGCYILGSGDTTGKTGRCQVSWFCPGP